MSASAAKGCGPRSATCPGPGGMPKRWGDVKVNKMNTKLLLAGIAVGAAAMMTGSGCGDEEVSTVAVAQAEPARAEAAAAPAQPSPATSPASPSTAAAPR